MEVWGLKLGALGYKIVSGLGRWCVGGYASQGGA
jgi:hypothetical protein